MHGRLKVKTTAEQAETKRLEREKKLKIYKAATQKAFAKRQNKEHDEQALHITGEILAANSDFYTLWNFRKEIFLTLKQQRSSDELQKLLEDELWFLESCLRKNPKSYGTWQQRCFVMGIMPRPNWKRELEHCNTFLEYDERNFHCWDYRRFVIQQSGVASPEDEFNFTTAKITTNFSNYSSWHYRSKLLPLINPDPSHPVGVTEDVLLKEFEIVQNAFFTDPDDQSAWFYHRWLLGRGEETLRIRSVKYDRDPPRLIVALSQHILVGRSHDLTVTLNGEVIPGEWRSPCKSHKHSKVWIFTPKLPVFNSNDALHIKITIQKSSNVLFENDLTVESSMESGISVLPWKPGTLFCRELSAATNSILVQELSSCQQLHELEPDNKWTLLTIVLLMKALDPLGYASEITSNLDRLASLDKMRRNYYADLRSRFIIENAIETLNPSCEKLVLSGHKLTSFVHHDFLTGITHLDVSNNHLTLAANFCLMASLQHLNLDDNSLSSTSGLENLDKLEVLSLKNNHITSTEDLHSLQTCACLRKLNLTGNPAVNQENYRTGVHTMLPKLQTLDEIQL